MIAWDDVFASFCEDPALAAQIFKAAEEGYEAYGRGCVFLRAQIRTKSSAASSSDRVVMIQPV
eukprot:gene14325-20310_t